MRLFTLAASALFVLHACTVQYSTQMYSTNVSALMLVVPNIHRLKTQHENNWCLFIMRRLQNTFKEQVTNCL